MTGIVILLYLVIGVGCGLIRLSAVAVGILALLPAAIGLYVASSNGALQMLIAGLAPLLVIEAAYFVTLLAVSRIWPGRAARDKADAGEAKSGTVPFSRKPQIREEP
ncbi:MAG: hypothetical protein KKB66_10220 [Alphaproteobacteria bacterium]|jgi:hypothetical protein|nr:hypothetical protein [Alphaproteobacteria bacterium]MBU0804862.1 hypothetical protein [Alphaproteobacteria bacterium]MBU0871809.1 hypothetical protein [Alphaproteobacteria bacterium]MBU1403562.1 hypothetical protein [Alphaproteobacteria bacterium]MBU1591538.1 hypothetical protein [Alphaproteobacteria bacterium]